MKSTEANLMVQENTALPENHIEAIIQYAQDVIGDLLAPQYRFHNFMHTLNVVNMAEEIAEHMGLNQTDKQLLLMAAWYHDLGYVVGKYKHEERGAMMLIEKFTDYKWPDRYKTIVEDAIMSTKMDATPSTKLGAILKDADMAHLSYEGYPFEANNLRTEFRLTEGLIYEDEQWNDINIEFFLNHQYITAYGKQVLTAGKVRNLKRMLRWRGHH